MGLGGRQVADVIVVNKADGSLLQAAQHTAAEYTHALHFQVCMQAGGEGCSG